MYNGSVLTDAAGKNPAPYETFIESSDADIPDADIKALAIFFQFRIHIRRRIWILKFFRSGNPAGKYNQQNLVGTYIEKFLQEGNSAPNESR